MRGYTWPDGGGRRGFTTPPHRLLVKMPRPSSATLFQSRRSHAPRRRNTRSTRSMAENCCGLDPWTYRPHACISEAVFARENDALTKALQISLLSDAAASSSSSAVPSRDSTSLAAASFLLPFAPDLPRGRDPPSGRIAKKRKSRATNRSLTTYITADPANFRQLVQQVTGTGPLDGAGLPVDLPPAAAAVLQGSCLLPTLDTSAFFLDRVGAVDAPVLAEFDSSLAAPKKAERTGKKEPHGIQRCLPWAPICGAFAEDLPLGPFLLLPVYFELLLTILLNFVGDIILMCFDVMWDGDKHTPLILDS
ncbi:hypothetical protein OPV22_004756 [Ensete ventricosum]|uniref:VQ domain-containing protein n=1 Tax=Ensete ventricosum TaxID=4639 RepID=A0AAV8RML7_ENSVE|nr:hypothetical protein OPV22_004756 [Ensete ventricosum]